MPKRFLIADDHVAIRRGVEALLRHEFPGSEVAEATTQPELNAKIASERWDLVVLDLSMPGRGGIECIGDIKDASPGTAVLVYTAHPEEQFGVRALRAGADAYVTKGAQESVFLQAAHRILEGKRFITETIAERMAEYLIQPGGAIPHELLSDREYEILRLIGTGLSVSDIADQLHLSVKTVSTYRKRVLEKLNLHSTGELIRYALENKIQ
jgi:two-component system invasion response regulator UvrY